MSTPHNDIWQFESGLGTRLMAWAAASVGAGAAMLASRRRFWRGVGGQFAGWGAIDAALALFGRQHSRRKAAEPEAHTPERQRQARTTLRTILWINAGLDVLYVTGGLALTGTRGQDDEFLRGTGLGIALQGAFLLLFDTAHALRLQPGEDDDSGDRSQG